MNEEKMEETFPRIIHCWSTPRTLSTATMYSFAQRNDTVVHDELLYPAYLAAHPNEFRPYRKELLESKMQDVDPNDAIKRVNAMHSPGGEHANKIGFVKHIAKFYEPNIDKGLLFGPGRQHIIMVRDPLEVVRAWVRQDAVHGARSDWEDVGFNLLVQIKRDVKRYSGEEPIIVDTEILRKYPLQILSELCAGLNIAFQEQMLSWKAGPKEYDGLWGPYWYHSVHKTTGFEPPVVRTEIRDRIESQDGIPLTSEQMCLYKDSMPFYELLRRHALGVNPLNPGSSVLPARLLYLPRTCTASHGPSHLTDKRNEELLAWIGDRLLPREHAKLSVFDSAVQGGDAVWEGIRVYNGQIFKLYEHLDRLFDGARAMGFGCLSGDGGSDLLPTRDFVASAIRATIAANGMTHDAHLRVTLSRGPKVTSSMNPKFNCFGACLIVLPEWKPVGGATTYDNALGISLITSTNRRNPPACVDSKIHHCNLINNILPKIQANVAGAADAIMLDMEGMVAETNATNIFFVKHGQLFTPDANACMPGLTRKSVMALAPSLGLICIERRVSLAEMHAADEVFTTGTMGEITPVRAIDGRPIGNSDNGSLNNPITRRMQVAYRTLTEASARPVSPVEQLSMVV